MNAGQKTLDWLYHEQLKIDDKWSLRTPSGFCWWADKNAQKIEIVGTETRERGETAYLVSVQTDFLRNVRLTNEALVIVNRSFMSCASMAAPVYNEKARTLKLLSFNSGM